MPSKPTRSTAPRSGRSAPGAGSPSPGNADRSRRAAVWVPLLGIPLLLRLLTLAGLQQDPLFRLLVVDARTYHEMAAALAGGSYSLHAPFWQPPFYPLILSLVYAVSGPAPLAGRIFGAILGSISCLLVFRIGDLVFGRRAAWIAWGMVTVYGTLIFFDLQLLNVTTAIFLFLWGLERTLSALPENVGRHSRSAIPAGGLLLGLAAITVAPLLLVAPVAAVSVGRRRGRRAGLLLLACALTPVLAVTAVNLAASGEPVIISYNAGVNFWIGNNPEYEATTRLRPGRAWTSLMDEPEAAGVTSFSGTSRYWFRKSLTWGTSHPGDSARLLLHKSRLLVRGDEVARNHEIYPLRRSSALLAALLWVRGLAFPFGLLLPLALAGMALRLGRKEVPARADESRSSGVAGSGLLAVVAGILAVSVVAFFVTARYRLPLVPILALFAGAGTASVVAAIGPRAAAGEPRSDRGWIARLGGPSRVTVATWLLALSLGAANLAVPVPPDDFHSDTFSDQGTEFLTGGDMVRAEEAYRHALSLDAGNLEAAHNLGVVLLRTGRLDEAAPLFLQVLRFYPDDVRALQNLGSVYLHRLEPYRAGNLYLRALRSDPNDATARGNLALAESMAAELERQRLSSDPGPFLDLLVRWALDEPENEFLIARLLPLLEGAGRGGEAQRVRAAAAAAGAD